VVSTFIIHTLLVIARDDVSKGWSNDRKGGILYNIERG